MIFCTIATNVYVISKISKIGCGLKAAGKKMLVAECLSRAQLPDCSEIIELTIVIQSVTNSAFLSGGNYNLCRISKLGYPTIIRSDNSLFSIYLS